MKNLFDTKLAHTDVEFERDLSFSLFTVLDVVSLSQVCFVIFPMDKNIEQRICLKFCIANGIWCAQSLKMLEKTYGESTLSKIRAYGWYSAFKSGWDVVGDLPRSGRPSTSSIEVNIAKVKGMVIENRHLSLRKIAPELSVPHKLIRTILNDCLGMKRVAAQVVLKNLDFLQKLNEYHRTTTVFTWYGSDLLFSLSKT